MPGKMSNYLEPLVINRFLRNGAFTPPAAVFVGLFTAFTEGADGDTFTEVSTSGTAYARQAITFAAPASFMTENTADITFPTATAGWGTPTYWGIFDSVTVGAGNLLYWGPVQTPLSVLADEEFLISAGELEISFTGGVSEYLAHKIIDHTLRNQAYTPSTTLHNMLMTAFTDDATFTEVADAAYVRQPVAFIAPTDGVTSNSAVITFPAADTGFTISDSAVVDAAAAGNILWRGPLSAPKVVGAGKQFKYPIAAMSLSID